MTTILNHHIVAALKMPAKIGDKLIKVQGMVTMLTSNAVFPTNVWSNYGLTFTQFKTNVTNLQVAEANLVSKTGTAATRNEKLAIVTDNLRNILRIVQAQADANPTNAITIIDNAGFEVKKISLKQKFQSDAVNTQITGKVLLTADGKGHHEWQMSKDEITIISLPATTTSKTYVSNLSVGDVWYFRNHKLNTNKTTYNWSPWIKLIISQGGKIAGGGNLPGHAGNLPVSSL